MDEIDREARELVGKAREYMEEHDWCQNRAEDNDGRVCVLGSLARAAEVGWETSISYRRARLLIADHLRDVGGSSTSGISVIPEWNDAPERTKEDVLLMMKKVESGE